MIADPPLLGYDHDHRFKGVCFTPSLSQCQILQDILPFPSSIDYAGLHGSVLEQEEFIEKYEKYLVIRDELLIDHPDTQSSLPGLHTGPQLPQARTSAGRSNSNPM